MSRTVRVQTSFASGELDPLLFGRIDLAAQQEGARRLRNVLPLATGGLTRRPGSRRLRELPAARRIISFDLDGLPRLLVVADDRLELLEGESTVWTHSPSPWAPGQISELTWAFDGRRLLLCHPDRPPQQLQRTTGGWLLAPWAFVPVDPNDPLSPPKQPYARFAEGTVRIQVRLPGGSETTPVPAGAFVEIVASAPVFTSDHLDSWLQVTGGHVRITNVRSPTEADGLAYEARPDSRTTVDWSEQALGAAHGWPRSVTFYQNRMVIGGSRDLPDVVWLSRSGDPFNFDPGSGLDDEAISFRLSAERRHRIRQLFPGRLLQIFTDEGEWVVKGDPLTPTRVRVELQTRIGSPTDVLPRLAEVDGATLFIGAGGSGVREFIFTDTEQAYQAADIALLSRHLVEDPRDIVFDRSRRLLMLLRGDGALAIATIDRNSNVVAWALQHTSGAIRAIEVHDRVPYLLVERQGRTWLERWEDGLWLDSARTVTSPSPTTVWSGLDEYVGERIGLFADGIFVGLVDLEEPSLTLDSPASELLLGIAYATEIEPVAVLPALPGLAPDALFRPIRVSFRLHETSRLTVDVGRGYRGIPLASVPFTGDQSLRAIGWRRGLAEPAWRIREEAPFAFHLLSATTELEVNR